MAIYAISDLHLSLDTNKQMDVFGYGWEGYVQKIYDGWTSTVTRDDTVVIPGDASWATYMEDGEKDFAFLHDLPGLKAVIKGNHDYWWGTVSKMERYFEKKGFNSIRFIHNRCLMIGETAICGTRGWKNPGDKDFSEEDKKIYERELIRLELSLKDGVDKGAKKIIAAVHFPPVGIEYKDMRVIELLTKYGADLCVYGHVHGEALKSVFEGVTDGVRFKAVSADYLGFKPILIG